VWPVRDASTVWLPAGSHVLESSAKDAAVKLVDFNGKLRSASAASSSMDFSYESNSRALAVVDHRPDALEIDGAPAKPPVLASGANFVVVLPRGQHLVRVSTSAPYSSSLAK
jgi:hypothetical protein